MRGMLTKKKTGYRNGQTTKSWHQTKFSCPEGRKCNVCGENRRIQEKKLINKFEEELQYDS